MADRLTQLQDALDQLVNQFIASLFYINKHHSPQRLGPTDILRQESNGEGSQKQDHPQVDPLPSDVFKAAQLELAQDLIVKEQQIEVLISTLPGLENSENDQIETLRQLDEELKMVESESIEVFKEKQELLAKLDKIIQSIRRP